MSGVPCVAQALQCWERRGSMVAHWDGRRQWEGTLGDLCGTPKSPVHPQGSETLCILQQRMRQQKTRRKKVACPGEGSHCPKWWRCSQDAFKTEMRQSLTSYFPWKG